MIDPFTFEPAPARATIDRIAKGVFYAEAKLDGIRGLLACTAQHGVTLTGRRTSDVTGLKLNKIENVPHLIPVADWLKSQYGDFMLDGEICYHGKSSNEAVSIMGSLAPKAREKQRERGLLDYVVFDIIFAQGIDWRFKPYNERRTFLEVLTKLIPAEIQSHVHLAPHLGLGVIDDAFNEAISLGYEGLILKSARGRYHHLEWAKVKPQKTFDMVIMGYDDSESETFAGNGIAALKLGLYKDGELVYCTRCSGMTHELRREFYENPNKYIGQVVEIKAQQMFKDTGACRHPRFVRFRSDLDAESCTFEKYGIEK